MNRTEFIGKLNALYVGDNNCLEELLNAYDEKDREIERLNKQLQLISDEFLKYDWENSSKEQVVNQLRCLYNSIFKGSDKK